MDAIRAHELGARRADALERLGEVPGLHVHGPRRRRRPRRAGLVRDRRRPPARHRRDPRPRGRLRAHRPPLRPAADAPPRDRRDDPRVVRGPQHAGRHRPPDRRPRHRRLGPAALELVPELVVNADDFGHSESTNDGIVRAREHGIVTSTSLMVRWPGDDHAARYARANPDFSVGLHIDFGPWEYLDGDRGARRRRAPQWPTRSDAQLERFARAGRPRPDPRRLPPSRAARRAGGAGGAVDWRRSSACRCDFDGPARYVGEFYGLPAAGGDRAAGHWWRSSRGSADGRRARSAATRDSTPSWTRATGCSGCARSRSCATRRCARRFDRAGVVLRSF